MAAIVLYLTMALMVWKSSAVPNHPTGCGIRNVLGLNPIVNRMLKIHEADFGEFPWTVALLHTRDRSYFGAGSLIHPRVVLTAAHKVKGKALDSFVIRAGEWDSQTTEDYMPYEERIPSWMTYHSNFTAASRKNNFALIKLEEAFPMKDHIRTVCLPPANFVPASRQTCFSGGWGEDSFAQAGKVSIVLEKFAFSIVPFDQCQQAFRRKFSKDNFLDQSFVCANGERNVASCLCDEGAPLVCPTGPPSQNRYHQTGIVTGHKNGVPALFASVSYARHWIDLQMRAMGFGTATYTAE